MKKRNRNSKIIGGFFTWLMKWRLALIGPVAIFIGILEFIEFQEGADIYHLIEIAGYFALLVIIAILSQVVFNAMKAQRHMMEILAHKHQLIIDLLTRDDWASLVDGVTLFPSMFAPIQETSLLISDPMSGQMEYVDKWVEVNKGKVNDPGDASRCMECLEGQHPNGGGIFPCPTSRQYPPVSGSQVYCFQIQYQNTPMAMLRLELKPGHRLSSEQEDLLRNMHDEVATAIKGGLDRKRFTDLLVTEAALAERRAVSHYLHDSLGQNLGYLRMKLDIFSNNPDLLKSSDGLSDLQHMKKAVEESYAIVRGKLEAAQPSTTPLLTNTLQEHAMKVSKRANFEIDFNSRGIPKLISLDMQRAFFYVFQEALRNTEKHAKASKVIVSLQWGKDKLSMTVADNGVGFIESSVDKSGHLGLAIMRERMAKVNGKVEIISSEKAGTTIKTSAPMRNI